MLRDVHNFFGIITIRPNRRKQVIAFANQGFSRLPLFYSCQSFHNLLIFRFTPRTDFCHCHRAGRRNRRTNYCRQSCVHH